MVAFRLTPSGAPSVLKQERVRFAAGSDHAVPGYYLSGKRGALAFRAGLRQPVYHASAAFRFAGARLHAGMLYVCTAQSARSIMPAAYSQMSGALKIRTRTYGSRPPVLESRSQPGSRGLCRSLTAIVQTCHVACESIVFYPARSSSDFRVALARQAFAGSWSLA